MKRRYTILVCMFVAASVIPAVSAQQQERRQASGTSTARPTFATPSSIREEHAHLRHQLDEAIASGGDTAARASAVANVLLPHFKAEEAYAMPPLGLLEAIANNQPLSAGETREAIDMAHQLRAHYDQMFQEHQQIHSALEALAVTAREEHKPEALAFAEALMLHAQNEEQVLYPTTLLIGKYLELRQVAGQ